MINVDIEVIHARPLFERLAEMARNGTITHVTVGVTVKATPEQMPALAGELSQLADAGHIAYEAKAAE